MDTVVFKDYRSPGEAIRIHLVDSSQFPADLSLSTGGARLQLNSKERIMLGLAQTSGIDRTTAVHWLCPPRKIVLGLAILMAQLQTNSAESQTNSAESQASSRLRSYSSSKGVPTADKRAASASSDVRAAAASQEVGSPLSVVERVVYQSGSLSDSLPPLPQGFPASPALAGVPDFPADSGGPTLSLSDLPQFVAEGDQPLLPPTPQELPAAPPMGANSEYPGYGQLEPQPTRLPTNGQAATPLNATQRGRNLDGAGPRQASQPASYQQPPNYSQPNYSQAAYTYEAQAAAQPPANSLSARAQPTAAGSTGLRPQQNSATAVTTGLPYVTPAPKRTGRYPTSPYVPAWRMNSPMQTIPPYTVAAQSRLTATNTAQANSPTSAATAQLASQQQMLPQFRQQPPVNPQPDPNIYQTAFQQCSATPPFPAAGNIPGSYVPPTYTPNLTPGLYTPNNAGYSPLFSLGQENYNVLLGRGIVGQPTVYVPGQPVRNFMRYIFP